MIEHDKINRYLPYELEGDPLIIVFRAATGLVAGAEFKLYKKDSMSYLKSWKLGSQDGEEARVVIERDTKLLNKHALTWQVLCCTKDVDIYKGLITIEFYQGEKKLKPNIPTNREMNDLPPCAIKRYNKFTEALLFVARI